MSKKQRPVVLTPGNLARLGVREWGLPTGMFIGNTWRSDKKHTVSCILPARASKPDMEARRVETRRVLIADRPEQQWLPKAWKEAMRAYKKQWPESAPRFYRLKLK